MSCEIVHAFVLLSPTLAGHQLSYSPAFADCRVPQLAPTPATMPIVCSVGTGVAWHCGQQMPPTERKGDTNFRREPHPAQRSQFYCMSARRSDGNMVPADLHPAFSTQSLRDKARSHWRRCGRAAIPFDP
jgi:hypothetical protein